MKISKTKSIRAIAKAKLSAILRLAETESPQRNKTFVFVATELWKAKKPSRKPMGQWLIENMPRGIDIEIPRGKRNYSQSRVKHITT